MNEQEALEIITNAIQVDNMTAEKDKALAVVQKALERQMPEKVVFGYDEQDPITCPDCKTELAYMDDYGFESGCYKYCPNCGKKLDWSDTE